MGIPVIESGPTGDPFAQVASLVCFDHFDPTMQCMYLLHQASRDCACSWRQSLPIQCKIGPIQRNIGSIQRNIGLILRNIGPTHTRNNSPTQHNIGPIQCNIGPVQREVGSIWQDMPCSPAGKQAMTTNHCLIDSHSLAALYMTACFSFKTIRVLWFMIYYLLYLYKLLIIYYIVITYITLCYIINII